MTYLSETQTSNHAPIPALCGLGVALLFCLLPVGHWLFRGDSVLEMLAREAIWWCFALTILLWLTGVERLPLSSIGFRRPTWKSIGFGLLVAVAVTAAMVLQFAVIIPMFHFNPVATIAQQQAILNTPFWYRVLIVLRAAVVEEILFRGYLIEKVRQLSGSTTLAVVLSVTAFTFAHLSGWGFVQLIPVAASGTIFACMYVWRRDLPSNMLGHFLSDALGFLSR